MPIELINSVRNSVLYLVTASGKCVTSRCQRPGPGACHGVCVVIVLSASVIVFSFLTPLAGSHRAVASDPGYPNSPDVPQSSYQQCGPRTCLSSSPACL